MNLFGGCDPVFCFPRTDAIYQADGMDALAVKQVMSYAKKYALEHGPIILELDTYRYAGRHVQTPFSMQDLSGKGSSP